MDKITQRDLIDYARQARSDDNLNKEYDRALVDLVSTFCDVDHAVAEHVVLGTPVTLAQAQSWACWFVLTDGGRTGEDHDRKDFAMLRAHIVKALSGTSALDTADAAREGAALTCYVCQTAIADGVRRCPTCANHVRCEVDGCDADMSSEKCPNDNASCLDHCGEDHT